ncbi:MAG: hypothetical protein LUD29_03215 [Clostridia bacterium]|nr:hypothetical protein [Clostridia bacterium]
MILFMAELKEKYGDHSDVYGKIAREVKRGNLISVSHGIYETDRNTDGRYLAGCIYGPSYLSFEFALAEYDLIPEAVYSFTSATFSKNKRKFYKNEFGNFSYRDIPRDAYPFGYRLRQEGEYTCQMASPEKALCDKLYIMPPVRSVRDIKYMLFENLRIEEIDFLNLSMDDILYFAPLYHCNNLTYLSKFIEREVLP